MKTSEKHGICPNCASKTSGNFCINCGQNNHLHKDTFAGMVTHFIAHYFHYDSKFQQTLKLLLARPGELTIAYREKKRQRYVAPISLYIFISIVFFLVFSIRNSIESSNVGKTDTHAIEKAQKQVNSQLSGEDPVSESMGYFFKKLVKLKKEKGLSYLSEKFSKHLPKVFFFGIPIFALLLKLIYIKRKDLFYVDHAVFALHFQTLWFILMFINLINPIKAIEVTLTILLISITLIYLVLSIRKVYGNSWLKSIGNCFLIVLGYLTFLGIAMSIDLFIILAMI